MIKTVYGYFIFFIIVIVFGLLANWIIDTELETKQLFIDECNNKYGINNYYILNSLGDLAPPDNYTLSDEYYNSNEDRNAPHYSIDMLNQLRCIPKE